MEGRQQTESRASDPGKFDGAYHTVLETVISCNRYSTVQYDTVKVVPCYDEMAEVPNAGPPGVGRSDVNHFTDQWHAR